MLNDFQDDDQDKGSEFLDEFRQRLNSQPLESLEERKNDINRSQHIFLGSILGISLAAGVSWLLLSPEYNSTPDAEIPVIRRPHSAVKIQPADPGGMEILNQDKTIYDIVEKKEETNVKVENLLPPPEEPVIPAIVNKTSEIEVAAEQTTQTIQKAEDIIRKEAEDIIRKEAEDKVSQKIAENIQNAPKVESIKEEKNTIEKPLETKSSAQPQTTKETTPAKAEIITVEVKENKTQTPSEITEGNWQIQLISSPNKAAMEKAWDGLTKKYSDLKNLPHEVESADLGSKGIFYRLKAGAFKRREDADKICNNIKSSGGSCLVKKKQ